MAADTHIGNGARHFKSPPNNYFNWHGP